MNKKDLPSIEELQEKIVAAGKKLYEKKVSGPISERLQLFVPIIKKQRENGLSYPEISKLIEEETGFIAGSQSIRKFYIEHIEKSGVKKVKTNNAKDSNNP